MSGRQAAKSFLGRGNERSKDGGCETVTQLKFVEHLLCARDTLVNKTEITHALEADTKLVITQSTLRLQSWRICGSYRSFCFADVPGGTGRDQAGREVGQIRAGLESSRVPTVCQALFDVYKDE